jgi:hypothetical protein
MTLLFLLEVMIVQILKSPRTPLYKRGDDKKFDPIQAPSFHKGGIPLLPPFVKEGRGGFSCLLTHPA